MSFLPGRDPRNPLPEFMIHTGSLHPSHIKFRKTWVLLEISGAEGPIYFIVEGCSEYPKSYSQLQELDEYYYNTHTCPTNFAKCFEEIVYKGDNDPHGVFQHVETIWQTDESAKDVVDSDYFSKAFPDLRMS